MQTKFFIVILTLCFAANAGTHPDCSESQQIRATTADGPDVILYPDGTWEFEDNRVYDVKRACIASSAEVDLTLATRAFVLKHTDGDTFDVHFKDPPKQLKNEEKIRLLGVDTPELSRDGVPEYFAVEAAEYTKERVYNKNIYLVFDFQLRDRYDRVLAYV